MCGLAGIAKFTKVSNTDIELVRKMISKLIHRGPDSEGFYQDNNISLGFRRLKIIDLNTGEQPISNEDGTIWTCLNGEVYNYKLLRKELVNKGHFFKTNTDTEVIVHAYEEYGTNFVSKLRGMFAIVLWDKKKKTLILCRDRFGKKPLYYYIDDEKILFASEIKALLQAEHIPKRIDQLALNEYLTYNSIAAPRSIIKNIKKLEPSNYLILDIKTKKKSIKKYWRLDYLPKENFSKEAAAEILREKIFEAVKIRMVSDVPIGALLSGGVDSSIVVAAMANLSDTPIHTFSIGFDEKSHDETQYAEQIANCFGTKHQKLVVKPRAIDVIPEIVRYLDEPMGDSSAIPTYYVCKMSKKYVTVVLNGDGGDEMFSGYNRYGHTLFLDSIPSLPSFAINYIQSITSKLNNRINNNIVRKMRTYSEISHFKFEEYYLREMTLFSEKNRNRLYKNDFQNTLNGQLSSVSEIYLLNMFRNNSHLNNIDKMLKVDSFSYLPNDLLVKMDRMSMANSLEARSPFLDHKISEFAARLPANFKRVRNQGKIILKKAFKEYLPENIMHRYKQGFAVPLDKWFRNELKEMLIDNLLSNRLEQRGYFNLKYISNLINDHMDGTVDNSAKLWSLLLIELWHQEFLD